METIIAQIRQALNANINAERAFLHDNFFKEEVKSYGLKASEVRIIAKTSLQQIKNFSKTNYF